MSTTLKIATLITDIKSHVSEIGIGHWLLIDGLVITM